MKKLLTTIFVFISLLSANAQMVNWEANQSRNFAYYNLGYDFGLTNQLGFAYQVKAKNPLVLHSDFSVPLGEKVFDDYKFRLGGQMLVLEKNRMKVAATAGAIFRRHETSLVRMGNVGLDIGATLGYYTMGWSVAGLLSYEHSLSTHLKHSEKMVQDFQGITDGWYGNTGGNFSYGFQFSKSIGASFELNLKLSKVASRFDHEDPLLPYQGTVGMLVRLGGVKN